MAKSPDLSKLDATVTGLRETQSAGAARLGQALDRLASQIGAQADVRAVFGEAITQQGITVIPVARVMGGFGAGAASATDPIDPDGKGGGLGAGGGFYATPVGFIEIDRNGARFRSLESPLGEWSGPAELALRMLASGVRALAGAVARRRG
jgi:uncharacterized spore protein YtfJ